MDLRIWASMLDVTSIVCVLATVVILTYLVPYLVDPHGLRSYPGPFVAKFSKLWMAQAALQGRTATAVREMHKKYGTI